MPSSATEALKIAREMRDKILSDSIAVSSALRACWTICTLLKQEREYEWISLELNGYYSTFPTVRDLEKILPEYRKARCLYFDEFGCPVRVAENLSFLEEFPLGQSVAELENFEKDGLHVYAGDALRFINERLKVPVAKAFVSSAAVHKVRNAVTNRVLDFLNSTIITLEYTQIQSDIFEKARIFVDNELARTSRPTLEKLVMTYRKLATTGTALEYSQIAFACRGILQDFTDAIFKPEYLRDGEDQPTHEETKNKLRLVLRERLAKGKERETNAALARVDYLNSYFDELTSYIQKQVHPKAFEPTADDANRCVIYTYLIIWDVIQLLGSG